MILKMAWKNMFRYKRRSLITASAVAFGVIFTVLFDALTYGIANETDINLLNYESSGAKFFAKGYFEKIEELPIDYLIERNDVQSITDYLDSKKISYTPELASECEIFFNEDYFETSGSITGALVGINPVKAKSVYKLHESIRSGTWLETNSDEPYCSGVVVGSWIADDMGAQLGYYITVQCKGRGGFTQTIDVPIVGILHCPDTTINSNYIFMDINYLNEMLEMDGAVTAIDVELGSHFNVDQNIEKLKKDLQKTQILSQTNAELKTWREINKDSMEIQSFYTLVTDILMIFMFVIAAVGISNTMLMSVLERKNEIGMLKAMGYSSVYIKRLFMCEGVSIGIVGCILGFAVACILNIPMSTVGINVGGLLDDVDMGFRINNIVRSAWDPIGFVKVTAGALITAGIAAFIPTGSTVKKEIADIFKN